MAFGNLEIPGEESRLADEHLRDGLAVRGARLPGKLPQLLGELDYAAVTVRSLEMELGHTKMAVEDLRRRLVRTPDCVGELGPEHRPPPTSQPATMLSRALAWLSS